MIRRETPKNIEKFIKICDEFSINELNRGGFIPEYIDKNFLYFSHSSAIDKYVKEHGINVCR